MDILTEKVSSGLVKYIRILQGSKRFNLRMKEFCFFHYGKEHCIQNAEKLDENLNDILKEFFIPQTEDNASYLLSYTRMSATSCKYTTYVDLLASVKQPHTLTYNEPCVLVKIYDEMNSREWADLKSHLMAETKKMDGLNVFRALRKDHHLSKSRENIDLLLEIYARREEALVRIYQELPQIKRNIGHRIRPSHSIDDIRTMLKEISKLIGSL